MPPVDEDHEKNRVGRTANVTSGLSELAAIPKIALVIKLDERDVIRTAGAVIMTLGIGFLIRGLSFGATGIELPETICPIGDTAAEDDDKGAEEAQAAKDG